MWLIGGAVADIIIAVTMTYLVGSVPFIWGTKTKALSAPQKSRKYKRDVAYNRHSDSPPHSPIKLVDRWDGTAFSGAIPWPSCKFILRRVMVYTLIDYYRMQTTSPLRTSSTRTPCMKLTSSFFSALWFWGSCEYALSCRSNIGLNMVCRYSNTLLATFNHRIFLRRDGDSKRSQRTLQDSTPSSSAPFTTVAGSSYITEPYKYRPSFQDADVETGSREFGRDEIRVWL